jgi:hypothetical protein
MSGDERGGRASGSLKRTFHPPHVERMFASSGDPGDLGIPVEGNFTLAPDPVACVELA